MRAAARCLVAAAALAVLLAVGGCARTNPYYDARRPHHTPEGFRNPQGAIDPGFGALLKWRWQAWRDGLPPPPSTLVKGYDFPVAKPDLGLLRATTAAGPGPGRAVTLTWIGHATLLLQLDGLTILTDPHFTRRAFPVSFLGPERKVPVPAPLAELPHVDLVVISHNHYDHLDSGTIRQLVAQPGGQPVFAVPLGNERLLHDLGAERVLPMDWWDSRRVGGVEVISVPVHHWSARRLDDRNENLWSGWALRADGFSFVFLGDTGYSPDFKEIGRRLGGFDLAAIPIGAYAPRWFMQRQHIDPDEAVQVYRDLGARDAIGIHWGTFELTDEALDRPLVDLQAALAKQGVDPARFGTYKHGETRLLRSAK